MLGLCMKENSSENSKQAETGGAGEEEEVLCPFFKKKILVHLLLNSPTVEMSVGLICEI